MAQPSQKKSTIVRTARPPQVALVRTAFRAIDPVAPAVTGRWALRIWCTPPHPRRPGSAAPELPAGVQFRVPLPVSGGRRPGAPVVVAEAWGEGPVVYLCHGWGGWRGQLTGLVAPLVAAGYRVVTFDAPGHGQSGPGQLGGRRSTLAEVAEALAAVVAVAGPAHAIIGHSGGGSATALAVFDGLAADRLVFIAPMADPTPYLHLFAGFLGLGARSRDRLLAGVERLVGRPLADFKVPARAAAKPAAAANPAANPAAKPAAKPAGSPGGSTAALPPLLVIHDRNDREVRYADGQAIAAAWPGATLHTTEGLGHRRILTNPAAIDAAVAFIRGGAEAETGAGAGVGVGVGVGAGVTATVGGSSRRS